VCLEVQLAAASIGYVGVQLGRAEVRVAEHLLDGAQIGAPLEQVSREGVAEQVWMDALGLEARRCGKLAQDQKGACARKPAALRVEQEIGPMPPVEVRPSVCEIPAQCIDGRPAKRNDPLLPTLSHAAHDPLVEVDR